VSSSASCSSSAGRDRARKPAHLQARSASSRTVTPPSKPSRARNCVTAVGRHLPRRPGQSLAARKQREHWTAAAVPPQRNRPVDPRRRRPPLRRRAPQQPTPQDPPLGVPGRIHRLLPDTMNRQPLRRSTPAWTFATYSSPATPTPARLCATTAHGSTSTGIPTAFSPPTWPPALDADDRPCR
jgi:hypothetical protein